MIDLTLVGLTTLAGYFFNKNGRNPRAIDNIRSTTNKIDKPNGGKCSASIAKPGGVLVAQSQII